MIALQVRKGVTHVRLLNFLGVGDFCSLRPQSPKQLISPTPLIFTPLYFPLIPLISPTLLVSPHPSHFLHTPFISPQPTNFFTPLIFPHSTDCSPPHLFPPYSSDFSPTPLVSPHPPHFPFPHSSFFRCFCRYKRRCIGSS